MSATPWEVSEEWFGRSSVGPRSGTSFEMWSKYDQNTARWTKRTFVLFRSMSCISTLHL